MHHHYVQVSLSMRSTRFIAFLHAKLKNSHDLFPHTRAALAPFREVSMLVSREEKQFGGGKKFFAFSQLERKVETLLLGCTGEILFYDIRYVRHPEKRMKQAKERERERNWKVN
jgi:hypothetical protein